VVLEIRERERQRVVHRLKARRCAADEGRINKSSGKSVDESHEDQGHAEGEAGDHLDAPRDRAPRATSDQPADRDGTAR
jgi:hypothetical protein